MLCTDYHQGGYMQFLIVDDHPLTRKGLIQVITCEPDYTDFKFDEVGTAAEAFNLLGANQYDMVLLDISLPDRSGLEILTHVRREKYALPVLVISAHPECLYAVRTLKMGAAGYITKTAATDAVTTAIASILSSGKYISPTVSLLLAHEVDNSRSSHAEPHELLSNREMEVACMIASGMSSREAAEQLRLSIKTINTHRSRLLAKLGLKNSVKLTAYCIQHHLI